MQIRPIHNRQRDSYDRIVKCVTHLIYLLVENAETPEEKSEMKQLIHDILRQNPKTAGTHDTLLHLCVSSSTTIKSCYYNADQVHVGFDSYPFKLET